MSHNQSRLKPKDSCINQLLSNTTKISKSVDKRNKTIKSYLDTSKNIDKVWHKGFNHKLKKNDIPGNLLDTATHFLCQKK